MKSKKILTIIILALLTLTFTGCSKTVENSQHMTGRIFTNKYMEDLDGITSVDYEEYWLSEKILFFEMSGKDEGYRGIIYISEEKAQELLEDYDDWSLDQTGLPKMNEVDTKPISGSDWYYSNDFASEYSTLLQIWDLRFNGKDAIIFDVHAF
ncbi:MAG: hypothetical protein K5659_02830 [Lachnospiraceae bacterium]|nr:hypothetical protein [Lachnospiraceae bacterium]